MSDPIAGGGPPPPRVPPVTGAVRLTQVAGGQYVLSANAQPVPPLSQITSIVTTNQALNQGGITRIVNMPNRQIIAIRNASPSATHQTIVNALQKPRQLVPGGYVVRPQGVFMTPTSTPVSSPSASPVRKRMKMNDGTGEVTLSGNENETSGLRKRILEHRQLRLQSVKESYAEHLAEYFYLQIGGDDQDFVSWRKKPPTHNFLQFKQLHRLDPTEEEEPKVEFKMTGSGLTPVAVSTQLPAQVAQLSQQGQIPGRPQGGRHGMVFAIRTTTPTPTPALIPGGTPLVPETNLPTTPVIQNQTVEKRTAQPAPAVNTPKNNRTPTGNQEQIVEKAKQEAYVMQRVNELQREGLWSEKRLPRVQEPHRNKVHWDYLLEEMVWLSADFAQERKWKKAAAKKCARMVQKYFQDKAVAAQKAEKAQEAQLKRIAAYMAREVRQFWVNIEKVVEYKQQTRLEEKRKQALDQHLSFIVDQTEKYSQLLAEGMNQVVPESSTSSRIPTPHHSDDEFNPGNQSSEDDEETIAQAEAEAGDESLELAALQRESELDLDALIKELPSEYLENRDKSLPEEELPDENEDEFSVGSESESDVEDTILEQEENEGTQDHQEELDELKKLGEMDIDDLKKMYNSTMEVDEEEEELDSDDDTDSDESVTEMETESEHEESTEVGLQSLLDDSAKDDKTEDDINNVAAIAESIQPKGNTLSSTSVVTPIPFLLKHSLREYQHIGLDWLVTMFDRRLNGILADEMGLGKTIQTIALLAHLACEKSDWGPHLIIVPTSVMLNWEMECKKWCPGFKILTYYGTQKERKLKRIGWTKPNAFHICITSYKLVIQDHQSFRRKKWKYLILDEAQNIKNFKSQRWQLLLNFSTEQRLLLTGTPLQNNLMELWSLMHFLMPNVFQSHREFKEWFSNPVTGMIEGNSDYNESIIKRLHKVLRPFLLRRLKSEVEKQMPKKYEHVVMCRLSKRQRYLYDDFMSRAKTRETLATGNLLSVINVLMQLRKVCNHPNLFEVRPTISPFQMEGISYNTASLVYGILDHDPLQNIDLFSRHFLLSKLESCITAVEAHRVRQLSLPRKLIEEIDTGLEPAPPCPKGRIRLQVKLSDPKEPRPAAVVGNSKVIKKVPTTVQQQVPPGLKFRVTNSPGVQSYSLQLVQHQNVVKTISLNPTTGQLKNDGAPQIAQFVHAGKHILLATSSSQSPQLQPITSAVVTSTGQRLAVLSKSPLVGNVTASGRVINANLNARTVFIPAVQTQAIPQLQPQSQQSIPETNHTGATGEKVISSPNITLSQPLNISLVNQLLTQMASNQATSPPPVAPLSRTNNTKPEEKNQFYDEILERRKKRARETKLSILGRINEERCSAFPLYGEDLRNACNVFDDKDLFEGHPAYRDQAPWTARGYANCHDIAFNKNKTFSWRQTKTLRKSIHTVEEYLNEMKEVLDHFVFFVPSVQAPLPKLHVSHPPPGKLWAEQRMEYVLQQELSKPCTPLHSILRNMATQFPDPRLIQFDCGKLQTLDKLLRRLKTEGHRVLIFTQMTKMLDVLEAFLNYHGHIYLRLDGTTKVDQRQVLMERFNGDKRIFVFILSTRSGGVGVNLTGADTVIFYDSDWNPTMDAQAQDRCHRIGQTRDVHIYRLVSEKTIEENILKKANQKRMLGDLAIEGGNFTTAFFKSSTIQDLFQIDAGDDASTRMSEIVDRDKERRERLQKQLEEPATEDRSAVGALESAFAACEDEQDVQAAKTAKAEAVAELAEFDENIPIEEDKVVADTTQETAALEPELSKAEQEVRNIVQQLTPIELYAMRYVEETEAAWSAQQLAAAEAEIEAKKRAWEEDRLAALRDEEEARRQKLRDDDELLTFSREDATNQEWFSENGMEEMPMWCPPTPPQNDNDVYIDHSMGFLYETSVMMESQLPPIYVKKELKRSRHEAGLNDLRRPMKQHRKEESLYAPRSLFDRPSQALVKLRRDFKQQKYRVAPQIAISGIKQKSIADGDSASEWLIHEDMALLQAVQVYQGLPLNLMVLSPGHTPNWDLVADFVNNASRIYRSPKQCKNRYELVIVPREEGRLQFDPSPKKQKKTKVYKTSPQKGLTRPLRTSQIYMQDNNQTFINILSQRFDTLRTIANKRQTVTKTMIGNQMIKTAKHSAILAQSGVSYDAPSNPIDVVTRRAERLAKESKAAKAVATPPAVPGPSQSPVPQVALSVAVSHGVQTPASVASTLRTQRINSTLVPGTNVVTIGGLQAGQLQPQRLIVAAPAVSRVTGKGVPTVSTAAGKVVSQAHLQLYRQQYFAKQQLRQLQTAGLIQQQQQPTTVVKTATTITTTTQQPQTVSIQQAQMTPAQRAHFLKQAAANTAAKQTIARAVTESEVAALIKCQQLQQQKGQQVQMFTQTVQPGTSQVATLVKAADGQVKTALAQGVKATTATPQQIRQLQIHPHLLAQRKLPPHAKVAQLTQVTNKALLVQTPKSMPATMTVQQLHQVMRVQGANAAQIGTATGQGGTQHVMLAKSGVPRAGTSVIPGQTHGLTQKIQVVTATSAGGQLAFGIRPQVSVQSTLAGALAGTIKVASSSQQALLSQVTAALQGQQVSMAVRQGGSPVRIQTQAGTPLVAVSMQSNTPTTGTIQQHTVVQQQQIGQPNQNQQQTQQDGQQLTYRVLKK